jgi:methyl-accepting chemotaxis protein
MSQQDFTPISSGAVRRAGIAVKILLAASRGANDSASAANHLSALADDLRRIVSQFKVA